MGRKESNQTNKQTKHSQTLKAGAQGEKMSKVYYSINLKKHTMHNKFSNCFVWVSPSTSDLKFLCCHEDTSAEHLTRISITKIWNYQTQRPCESDVKF